MAELKFEVPEGTVEGLFSEPGGEGFRVLVEAVAQALINSQAEAHFGAPWNARGMERPNGYRNGYKSRGFQTVAGALDLSIPQARSGGFRPTLFDRWQRSERALLAACGEMVLAGVSNRNVSRLAEEAFGAEVSPSLVSPCHFPHFRPGQDRAPGATNSGLVVRMTHRMEKTPLPIAPYLEIPQFPQSYRQDHPWPSDLGPKTPWLVSSKYPGCTDPGAIEVPGCWP